MLTYFFMFLIIMASLHNEPQGLDSFSEGLASFQQQEIQQVNEPTAAVESASLNIKPKKHVTIVEPNVKPVPQKGGKVQEQTSDYVFSKAKIFYEENQILVLGVIGLAVAYYFYKKNK